jgi:hypothetical protein
MAEHSQWVFLAYRLPREPSTPRITVWRKLKRLGVVHILDGLVGLPLDARNREQLEWIADEVLEHSGTATIWTAGPTTRRQERDLIAHMQAVIDAEYDAVIEEAAELGKAAPSPRALKRLRAEIRRIERRDYFPTGKRKEARRAVARLAIEAEAAT